jgi:hypothetical protein
MVFIGYGADFWPYSASFLPSLTFLSEFPIIKPEFITYIQSSGMNSWLALHHDAFQEFGQRARFFMCQ